MPPPPAPSYAPPCSLRGVFGGPSRPLELPAWLEKHAAMRLQCSCKRPKRARGSGISKRIANCIAACRRRAPLRRGDRPGAGRPQPRVAGQELRPCTPSRGVHARLAPSPAHVLSSLWRVGVGAGGRRSSVQTGGFRPGSGRGGALVPRAAGGGAGQPPEGGLAPGRAAPRAQARPLSLRIPSARICSARFIGAIGASCIGAI